jgi:hypothetical protein
VGSMAAAQAAVAREQILVERSLLHLATDDGTDVRVVGAVPPGPRMPVAPHASVAANGASETRLDAGEIAQIAPGPVPREVDIHEQSERAQDRLVVARDALRNLLQAPDVATAPELTSEMAAHTRIYKRLHHVPPDMAARRIAAEELEPIDRSLSNAGAGAREPECAADWGMRGCDCFGDCGNYGDAVFCAAAAAAGGEGSAEDGAGRPAAEDRLAAEG